MHLDQNPITKPNLETVQGMVPLRPVTAATGGLAVIPESHTTQVHNALIKRNYFGRDDWCPLSRGDPFQNPDVCCLLLADPGDLILWDSRTVHGGVVGPGFKASLTASALVAGSACPLHENPHLASLWQQWQSDFARLSVTVCMTQRNRATDEVLRIRRAGYKAGRCFNHTPHEPGSSGGTLQSRVPRGYKPCPLTAEQNMLLDGTLGDNDEGSGGGVYSLTTR